MPEYKDPGVYVEEDHRPPGITWCSTNVAAFVGPTARPADSAPVRKITSYTEYLRYFGGVDPSSVRPRPVSHQLDLATRAFFANGGRELYVAPCEPSHRGLRAALESVGELDDVSLVAAPFAEGLSKVSALNTAKTLIQYCEGTEYRFALVDPPCGASLDEVQAFRAELNSTRAALYYPWLLSTEGTGKHRVAVPPSSFVAGLYARIDSSRGVHKAPVNEVLTGAAATERPLGRSQQELLNPQGINCIVTLEDGLPRVFGARTITTEPEWKYVNVRRLFDFIERSLDEGLRWVVSEPNDETLWNAVRHSIESFLFDAWRTGMSPASTPEEAFYVRCDRSTMTQADIDNGRLISEIGFAPLKPAEFVIFRIGQWTSDARAT